MSKRHALVALIVLFGSVAVATPAISRADVSISVSAVGIGFHQPTYPELVLVPGYPVYHAPRLRANYFFYDGLYWLYHGDQWYASEWYDGPWDSVDPDDVPLYVLRVPVSYYLAPPVYFHGWVVTAPPRWDLYWGPRWTRYHHGWTHWDRHVILAPAPLPVYQRHYAGDHYPRPEYQRVIRREHYRYQSREAVARRYDQRAAGQRAQSPAQSAPRYVSQPPQQRHDDGGRLSPALQADRVIQQQRRQPPQRQEINRRPVHVPQGSPPAPRAQPTQRQRTQQPTSIQAPLQQRAPAIQAQQFQPRPRMEQHAQHAQRPQVRRESHQPRANSGQQRTHDRGRRQQ